MKIIFIFLIKLYQNLISPLIGPRCRFYPTCSKYAVDALETHSILSALFLIFLRVIKCHPFHKGGVDFVPLKLKSKRVIILNKEIPEFGIKF